ncbi:MAG: PDZ domain-containing protein [Pseudomonadaceae bacterium]|nr:PDZ domain-containing protein [Pseudomonadaceae bacterium]
MSRVFIAFLMVLLFSPVTFAGDEKLDKEIAEVQRNLDEAARALAELYRQRYSAGEGKDRAMLGILLGDGAGEGGVELFGVTPGGGADQAGLVAGDLIVKMDELSISDAESPMRALSNYMKQVSPGDEVVVVFERAGERQTATVTTQAHSKHMMAMVQEKMGKLGDVLPIDLDSLVLMPDGTKQTMVSKTLLSNQLMSVDGDLADYFDVDAGVLVLDPAPESALKAGDILLSVNDVDVTDLEMAYKLLGEVDGEAEVGVKRRGKNRTLDVKAGALLSSENITQTRVIRINAPDEDGKEVVVKIEVTDD